MITHVEKMRVSWVDTDASTRIHYTAALRYFETAEHGLMRKLFAADQPETRGFMLPRVHVEADFKVPLRFGDEFECEARVNAFGRSSVTYGYEVRRPNGELCVIGRIVAVAVGDDGKAIPLPEAFRAGLARAV